MILTSKIKLMFFLNTIIIFVASVASSNDSSSELAVGGLILKQNDHIEILSEDLLISPNKIRVEYTYFNHHDEDLELLVSFPIPDFTRFDDMSAVFGDVSINASAFQWSLNFETLIDGKEINWFPYFNQKSSSSANAECKRLWMKRNQIYSDAGYCFASDLGQFNFNNTKCKAIDARLTGIEKDIVKDIRRKENELNCSVDTKIGRINPYQNQTDRYGTDLTYLHINRLQKFPSKKILKVVHEYKPVTGGGIPQHSIAEIYNEASQFIYLPDNDRDFECLYFDNVDRSLVKNWMERAEETKTDTDDQMGWVSIGYILSTAKNWKGTIGNFRLEVTDTRPFLIQTCFEGLRRVSENSFVFHANDFRPSEDLRIILLRPEFF